MANVHRLRVMLAGAVALLGVSVAAAQPINRTPAPLRDVIAVEPADSTYGAYRIVFTTATPLPPASDAFSGQGFFLDGQKVTIPPYAPEGLLHFGYIQKLPTAGTATLRTGVPIDMTRGGEPTSSLPVNVTGLLAAARPKDGEFEAPHMRRSDQSVDLVTQWADAQLVCVARYVRLNSDPDDKTLWQMHFESEGEQLRGPAAAVSKTLVFRSTTVPAWYEIGARYLVFARLLPATQRIDPRELVAVRIWWTERDPVFEFVKQADRVWPPAKAKQDPKIRDDLAVTLRSPAPEVRLASALAMTRLGRPPAAEQAASLKLQLETQIPREPVEVVRKALSDLQRMTAARDRKP